MAKVLCGLHGVLLRAQDARDRARMEKALGISAGQSAKFWEYFDELRPAYDAGVVSDKRWWQKLASRMGVAEFDVAEAIKADFESRLESNDDVVDFVQGLIDDGHVVGVVANLPTGLASLVRAKHLWLEDFAAVTLSCDIGVCKPAAESLSVATDALGCAPKDTLYFDSNPVNVAAAREFGLQAYEFGPGTAEGIATMHRALGLAVES